jgi:predicted DNA-binding transcriptional regulator AlpA
MEEKTNERNQAPRDRLLPKTEVAERLALTVHGVDHLHRTHRLRAVIQSGKRFWPESEIDDYIEQLRAERG